MSPCVPLLQAGDYFKVRQAALLVCRGSSVCYNQRFSVNSAFYHHYGSVPAVLFRVVWRLNSRQDGCVLEFPVTFCVSASQRKQRMLLCLLKVGRICLFIISKYENRTVSVKSSDTEEYLGGLKWFPIKEYVSVSISKHRFLPSYMVSA